ncbi:MAG: transglutaminaseTgpA domain-containing protein [Nocardioidaceae bacterium]
MNTQAAPPLLSVFAWLAAVAAALAFVPLLDDNGYVFTAAVLTAGPLAAALLLRWVRTPSGLVLLGQLAALAVWGTWLHFPETALGGLLPTSDTLQALGSTLTAGVETANDYAPPAPATEGLVLLTTLSITACYLMIDLLGVGLGRAPLTGLPLLALYTVPAALAPDGVPVLAFVPGAAAFLLLLAYDERERLGHWGRQVSTLTGMRSEEEQRRLNTSAVNAAATRVGAVALGSAAVLPLFIPVLPEGMFGGGPGAGGGNGEVRVTNPIVDLRRDLVERSRETAMEIRTRDGDASYFRLAALDEFDGEKWRFSDRDVDGKFDVSGALSAPPGLDADVRTRTEGFEVVVSNGFQSDWLPVPYAPTRVQVGGEWRYDPATLDIVAGTEDESTAGRGYSVTAMEVLPTFEQLDTAGGAPTSVSGRYTDVPDNVPDRVGDAAERITDRSASRFQSAVLLQEWFRFRGGFRYSLQAPGGHSGDDIVAFLDGRVGYCEQFAAAMALMARELNIPARVAVGFLNASPVTNAPSGLYRYTFADMHAWPELYFEGVGWVRFEPTPAARGGSIAPPYTQGTAEGPEPLPTNLPTAPPAQAPAEVPSNRLDPGSAPTGGGSEGGTSRWWYAGGAAALLVLLTPGAARVVVRRRRLATTGDPLDQAEAVWAELRDSMRDLRYDWPTDTPRRTSARVLPLLHRREGAESALRRLALNVERARFARTPGDGSTLRHDLALVVTALKARESRWDLFKAALLPRSLRSAHRRQNRAETQSFRNLTLDADASALQAAP